MLDPFHIFSSRQAEEEYSKLKLRLEAIKRGQEEAAAKVALENKEAATENYEADKENKEAVMENKEAAKVTLDNKETVSEKETEKEQKIRHL